METLLGLYGRPPVFSEKTHTEVVRARHTVIRDWPRLSYREQFKDRGRRGSQSKRWEDNIKEWTGLEWNIILRKSREPRGVEEVGCKMYSGAPTVSQDYGIGEDEDDKWLPLREPGVTGSMLGTGSPSGSTM